MKTMKCFFAIVALFVYTATGVFAQTPQTVTQGSTHHYHVTDHSASGYSYAWSLAVQVAGNTIATPTVAGTDITWGTAGTYTITLTETNTVGACATTNTFQVIVLGLPVLQFTDAASAGCADQAMNLSLNFTRTDGTTPITAADASYFPLVVNYSVSGVVRTATFNAGDALVLPLTLTDRADLDPFVASRNIPVIITSALSNGGVVTIGGAATHTDTVYDIPELNPIVAD